MDSDQKKNPISVFYKAQSDIIALVLIIVLAAAGIVFRQKFLLSISLIIALINFAQIYFGTREKQDERTQHQRNLAGYHTLIAVFLLVWAISVLNGSRIIKDLDVQFLFRIVTWSIGFIYALAYSIIKRQQ